MPNLNYFIISAEITHFQAANLFQGLTHENGRLKVQEDGLYYIYAQVFFESYFFTGGAEYHNRVALVVNGATFSIMETALGGKADYGSVHTGGAIHLRKGDYMSLVTRVDSQLWVSWGHTFFGAYKIVEQTYECAA